MRTNKILSAALIIASLLWGAQMAHASDPVSISSVGHMDNDTGFVLNIPEIHKYNANLPKESFFATTSSSGFNASGIVDCAFVINNSDGSHDIIVSGTVISTAESGSLVPPGLSQYNLTNNQYYGRVKIDAAGILSRSNFPSEFEGCAFSGNQGEPETAVLPAGFPRGSVSLCNDQMFENFNWITCKELKGKSISVLEKSYGLSIDRNMDAGITIFP